jgi:hypothetical protein
MDIYRKIAIIFIILITTYILYRLYNNRKEIIHKYQEEKEKDKEGFQDPIVDSLSKSNTNSLSINNSNFSNITSTHYSDPKKALSISQYSIKSSYQTAWDGQDVSQDMIQYILNRGCRWLHFDIFWDKPSKAITQESNSYSAVVSYTTDPNYLLSGISKLGISDVFNFLSQNAFTTCPNNKDPLFIQLTPKYNDPSDSSQQSYRSNLYQSVAHSIISNFLVSTIYTGEINAQTSIQSLMGKVIFIIDNTISPENAQMKYCNTPFPQKQLDPITMPKCYELMNYVNIIGNDNINMATYYYENIIELSNNSLQILNDGNNGYDVNKNIISQVLPLDKKGNIRHANTDFRGMSHNYSINIVPMMYWINDVAFQQNEGIYNARGSAIVPMSYIYKYIKDNPV